jgi:tetratricopeptide (TPR) repeat protein
MPQHKATQSPVKDVALMLEAGYVYRYASRFREAREIFQGVRALLPMKDTVELAFAGLCLDEGKFAEAQEHCRLALKANPGCPAAYIQLAEIQLMQHDMDGARKNLQRSLEISPNGPTVSTAKALIRLADTFSGKAR